MSFVTKILIFLINLKNYITRFFDKPIVNENGDKLKLINRTNLSIEEQNQMIKDIIGNDNMYYIYDGSQQIVILANYVITKEYYKHFNKTIRTYPYLGYVYEKLLKYSIGAFTGENLNALKKPLMQFFNTGSIKKHFDMIIQKTDEWILTNFSKETQKYELQNLSLDKLTINILGKIIYGNLSQRELNDLYELSLIHKQLMVIMGQDMLARNPNIRNPNKVIVDSFWVKWSTFNTLWRPKSQENTLFATLLEHDIYKENHFILYQTLYEIMLFNSDIMVDAFANLIWNIASNKNVADKILDEVENINMTSEEINKLEYLTQVENESARLNPGIVLTFAETLTENIELNNYKIPANTKISIDTQMVNRDPKVWSDPDEFKPERFDTQNPSLIHKYHRFGMGPRKCLGNVFATYILKIGVISLIKKFDITSNNNEILIEDRKTIPNISNTNMANEIVFTKR